MAGAVSVVVPCHNYAEFVAGAVDSVLGQRCEGALEVIVVDDASTDASWAAVQRFAHDRRVRLVRHDRNLGHVATYNEGMALATGDYVVILSADDAAWAPDALASQARLLEANPSVAFVFSQVQIIDERGRSLGRRSPRLPPVTRGRAMFRRLLLENPVSHSGTMVRRVCAKAVGPFDEALVYTHDWDMWLRLASRYDVGFVARPLYAYRIHRRQLHARDYSRSMTEWLAVLDRARALGDVSPGLYRLSLAKGHAARAHAYMARGEYASGLRDLAVALRLQPRGALFLETLKALAHLGLGLALGSGKERFLAARRRGKP